MVDRRLTVAVLALALVAAAAASTPSAIAQSPAPSFAIEAHSRSDVPKYEKFTYDTATAVGVSDAAAARIDATISTAVSASVRRAVKASARCLANAAKCGVYEGQLVPVPCIGGYLCILNHVDGYNPGAATGYKEVDAFVFDPATGARVSVADEVTPAAMPAFVTSVKAQVEAYEKKHGFYNAFFVDFIRAKEIQHWAPMANGIRLWFDKYVAAPGYVGVVSLVVPYPSTATIRP